MLNYSNLELGKSGEIPVLCRSCNPNYKQVSG
jgi:hypothetical protein